MLDLFSGCGGISLGFQRAGFDIIAGLELSREAVASHGSNFHRGATAEAKTSFCRPRDVSISDPVEILREVGHHGAVDVIVGGPPCQAYARVGRAKLREVMDHPEAFTLDDRGHLFLHYLRFVSALRPAAILMENVPDILNYGGRNIADEIASDLGQMGYDVRYAILNAANYGVPQLRERWFLVGLRNDLGTLDDGAFPIPTHHIAELPKGYASSRAVATRPLRETVALWGAPSFLVRVDRDTRYLPPAVTAREAIADLPSIDDHVNGRMRRGPQRFGRRLPYRPIAPSAYATAMRSWPGFESDGTVDDHVIRYLPRDYPIFAKMRQGDQYPEALRLAERLFEAALEHHRRDGVELAPGSDEWEDLRRRIVPPYDASKFPNKWRKLEEDRPSRTLMAHLGKDSYSHIHYDDAEARTISVREAARLQSFPDGFRFAGSMNAALRQIGNAVPPLLAYALGAHIGSLLSASRRRSHGHTSVMGSTA